MDSDSEGVSDITVLQKTGMRIKRSEYSTTLLRGSAW